MRDGPAVVRTARPDVTDSPATKGRDVDRSPQGVWPRLGKRQEFKQFALANCLVAANNQLAHFGAPHPNPVVLRNGDRRAQRNLQSGMVLASVGPIRSWRRKETPWQARNLKDF
jgi:hypothetical protein